MAVAFEGASFVLDADGGVGRAIVPVDGEEPLEIDVARLRVPDLIDDGQVSYSWMGITSQSNEDGFSVAALAEALSLPVQQGVLISGVTSGSPAARAGLRAGTREVVVRDRPICTGGDIIIAVNDTLVRSMDDLVAYLVVNTRPGDTVTLRVVRGPDTFDLPVTLDSRPTDVGSSPQVCG
jgi:2-alkenal reductase